MASLYAALGVERSATPREIKRAYYALAHQCHPDKRPGDADAASRFHAISLAYTVLGNAATRRRYDLMGPMALGLSPSLTDLSVLGPDAERLAQMLGQVVGGVMRRIRRPKRAKPQAKVRIPIDVATLLRGGAREVRVPRQVACPGCLARKRGSSAGANPSLTPPCATCRGKGHIMQTTAWLLHIPADTGPDDILRMAGAHGQGDDLFVHLDVTSHPLLRRRGLDLYVDLIVSPAEAALGATVLCALPHRNVPVPIAAGIQAGTPIVLRGLGLRSRAQRGDLHLTVEIETPTAMGQAHIAAWQALYALEQANPQALPQRLQHARAMNG